MNNLSFLLEISALPPSSLIASYGMFSVHIFSRKGQGGNDQKGHFCQTKGHFLIDKRALFSPLANLSIYYR